MASSISSSAMTAQAIASLIADTSTTAGSMFSTLAGSNTGNTNQALFNALGGNAGTNQSVDSILAQRKTDAAKQSLFATATQQIDDIQQGKADPKTDWQKVAGYAMAKGKPFVLTIDASTGGVTAELQSDTDLTKHYNTHQVQALKDAMAQIDIMAQKIQANAQNDEWLNKLEGASNDVYQVANSIILPQTTSENNWEQTAVLCTTSGAPVKISLDAQGKLQATNQEFSATQDGISYTQQEMLTSAIDSIATTIQNGTASQDWELQAQAFALQKIPYYLEIDTSQVTMVPDTYDSTGTIVESYKMVQGKVVAKENSAENITPDFLKTAPYPKVGDDTDMLKQVEAFIKDKKPYYLDFDSTGNVVAKAITSDAMMKFNTAKDTTTASTVGTGYILTMFA